MLNVRLISGLFAVALLLIAAGPAFAQENAPYDEAALLAALETETEYTARMNAYRGLRQVGTAASVPAIAKGLHDLKESHLARYALEDMPFPEAGAALRGALEGVPEEVLPGLLASLGARRDAEGVAAIQPLLGHANANVARAAAAALGRIASAPAVEALMAVHQTGANRLDVAEGLLAAGQQLAAEKKRKEALAIFQALRKKENPEFVRAGAFYGLAQAAPNKTPERVVKALQGRDPLFRNLAREVVADTKGKPATAKYVAALPQLPADAQVMLLEGLTRRGDKSAREGVLPLVGSDSAEVRTAAVTALGSLGGGEDVPLLAGLLEGGALSSAARSSLIRLRGPAVDNRIVQTMPDVAPAIRAQLLELLAVRIAPQAVNQARKHLNDGDGAVRLAALRVLQQQGTVAELPPLIERMNAGLDTEEFALASRALGGIAAGGREEALPIVLASIEHAPDPVQIALVDALGRIGGTEALQPVLKLLDSGDAAMQKAALQVLATWPSQDAAPALLDLAKSEDPARHDAGLRGYTRLAENHPEHDPKNAMMAQAMELARTKEEKWMILSAYGNVHSGPALDMLESQLDDPEVQREASMALLKVAEGVGNHGEDGKARARKSMELLKEKAATDAIRAMADKMLERLK
ncbi:MAG: HEAT repeat domain-containing protein [Candidatus Hydrogenedentes bacterium]|nr:HEAT repeat domain-containing protein [Candidatus Hydrogenedentota bacterium]